MNRKIKEIIGLVVILMVLINIIVGCSTTSPEKEAPKVEEVSTSSFTYISEENMEPKRIMAIIEELTSEKYDGRLSGTEGNEMAAEYIANYFKEIGLEEPMALENYMQYFNHNVRFTNSASKLSILNDDGSIERDFKYVEEFNVNTRIPALSIKGEATGKAVVLDDAGKLSEIIKNQQAEILLVTKDTLNSLGYEKLITLVMSEKNSIKSILIEVDIENPNHIYNCFPVGPNARQGAIFAKDSVMLFLSSSSAFEEIIKASNEGLDIHMKADYSVENVRVPNVVGLIPGSDEKAKDKYIIVGAHFDHVGDNKDGTYNPGALDNGSGAAMMMDIAKILMENKEKPKKSILFIAFNGEEEGLYGSQYYASNPLYPLESDGRTVMINLDMVGSKKEVPLVIGSYSNELTKIRDEFHSIAQEMGIVSETSIETASDHAPFGARGIDSVFLINMDFKTGYHTPKDIIDTNVDEDRIEEVERLVLQYIDRNGY